MGQMFSNLVRKINKYPSFIQCLTCSLHSSRVSDSILRSAYFLISYICSFHVHVGFLWGLFLFIIYIFFFPASSHLLRSMPVCGLAVVNEANVCMYVAQQNCLRNYSIRFANYCLQKSFSRPTSAFFKH